MSLVFLLRVVTVSEETGEVYPMKCRRSFVATAKRIGHLMNTITYVSVVSVCGPDEERILDVVLRQGGACNSG